MQRAPANLSAKYVGETDVFSASFVLAAGETISTCAATMSLEWGADASVSSMINGSVTISGDTVSATIDEGIAGNIYLLTFTAVTSAGRTLQQQARFVVR